MGLIGKIYHPTPRNTTIQAVLDSDAEYNASGRKLKMAIFNQDETPISSGLVLKSPDGTPYRVSVDNAGELVIAAE